MNEQTNQQTDFANQWITKQAAIDALYSVDEYNALSVKAIKDLPSAQPQRIKGKWVRISPAGIYECSICGKNVMTSDIDAYDFCHGCGADMRRGKEDE